MKRRVMLHTLIPGMVAALLLTSCGGGGEGDDADALENESPPQAMSTDTSDANSAPSASEAASPLGEDYGDGDDRVDFVTTPSTTTTTSTTTTEPTTTTSTTTSTTTTTTTTTTSTSTTTTPPPTTIRCSLAADALFEPNEAVLTPAAVGELERIVSSVSEGLAHDARAGMARAVTVEGHTDHRGSDDENLALSQARADAASAALVDAGIDQDLITAVGLGEAQATQDDPSDDQMAADRRVDIVIEADVPITTTC